MDAKGQIVLLIREKQAENPKLSHEAAYQKVCTEHPEAVEKFLIEIGVRSESTKESRTK